jgi:hypothetical protein
MRTRWISAGAGALAFGVVLVLFRAEPIIASDQGVFLSVAARVLDGDRLYAEVIENKDPLFFYTYAAGLWIAGWRGAYLLDGVWLGIAALSFALLLRELRVPRSAVVAGFLVYPLALTSGWYVAGHAMLAGLAFAPLAAWLWLRGNFAASGAVLGTVMLFKLHVAAVAAAPLCAFVLLGAPDGLRSRPVVRAGFGLAATLAVAALVLAVRGELRAYLDVITYNVYYSSALVEDLGPLGRAEAHLDVVTGYFKGSGRWQFPAAILVLGAFSVAAVYLARKHRASRERLLAVTAAVTLVLTLGTLVLTAYWFHHLQMLAYPAALIAATLISVVAIMLGQRAGAVAAAACVVFALWSSAKNEDRLAISSGWTSDEVSATAGALEEARARLPDPTERVRYMVFGGNSENAHAVFLEDGFDLVCRWFFLFPHSLDAQLEETTECSRRERPELILVTLGFYDRVPQAPEWEAFVASARQLLEDRYELVVTAHPGFEVWKRKTPVEA